MVIYGRCVKLEREGQGNGSWNEGVLSKSDIATLLWSFMDGVSNLKVKVKEMAAGMKECSTKVI